MQTNCIMKLRANVVNTTTKLKHNYEIFKREVW